MKLRQVATAVCATALTSTALVISSAAPAAAGDARLMGSLSIPCGPAPLTSANFSWNPGSGSVTVYYNNHCATPKAVTVAVGSIGGTIKNCVVAPGLATGSKKITYGLAGTFGGVWAGC